MCVVTRQGRLCVLEGEEVGGDCRKWLEEDVNEVVGSGLVWFGMRRGETD